MKKRLISVLLTISMIITGTLSAYADEVPVVDFRENVLDEVVDEDISSEGIDAEILEEDLDEIELETDLDEVVSVIDEIEDIDSQTSDEYGMALGYDDTYERNIPIESIEVMSEGEDGSEWLLNANDATRYTYYNPVSGNSIPAGAPMIELQPIRNQNPYGSCWAHAAIFLSELAMRKNDWEDKNVNLSELQLTYFLRFLPGDPLGNSTDKANHSFAEDVKAYRGKSLEYDMKNGFSFLNRGGNTAYGGRVLANWIGAASEDISALAYGSFDDNVRGTGNAEYRRLNGYNDAEVELYARNADVGHLSAIYDLNAEDDPAYIKQMIYEYGGVSCSYYHDNSNYNKANNCYMSNMDNKTNHAIAIVGWDDNFSKNNFRTYKPDEDGAWMVRNSWGLEGYGCEGYFWMSYEEPSLGRIYAFDFADKDNYDNNYYYDGAPTTSTIGYSGFNEKMYEANVFTAKANKNGYGETLKAVGFETANTNLNYTINIYNDVEDINNPTSGILVHTESGMTRYQGYHTVDLDVPIELEEGDRYSVVICFEKAGVDIDLPVEYGYSNYIFNVTKNRGESFMSYNGVRWMDMTDVGSAYGNIRIKAFTANNDVSTCLHIDKDVDEVNHIDATCVNDETIDRVESCRSCEAIKAERIILSKALGHDWDEGIIALEPTHTEEGITIYQCKRCHIERSEAIEKLEYAPAISYDEESRTYNIRVVKGGRIRLDDIIKQKGDKNWKVGYSSKKIASVASNGYVKGSKPGSTTATVEFLRNNTVFRYTINIEVEAPKYPKGTLIINKGEKMSSGFEGTELEVKFSMAKSKKEIATVNSDSGIIEGKSYGKTKVIVEVGGKKYTRAIQVLDQYITGKNAVKIGKSIKLKLKQGYKKTTWYSNDDNVMVNSKTGAVKGLAAGEATIYATNNGVTVAYKVLVY